ncbi:MAG: class I adenylate-forming enzyme family protein [Actinomycetota bacterium]
MYQELRQVWDALTGPGGQFEITDVDVRGQMLRTYKNQPPSLREFWLMAAAHGENDYLVYGDERLSYTEAHRQVAQVATWLQEQGVQPGDRVAIAMRNYPEWLLAYWACVSTGVACVGMNAWWVGPEIVYGIEDADPKVVIADTERLAAMLEVKDQLGDRTFVGVRIDDLPPGVVPWDEITVGDAALPEVAIDPDADACIFYTSGTTGRPKGAQLTHRGCVANVMSLAFSSTAQTEAAKLAQGGEDAGFMAAGAAHGPSSLVTTPLFHVTANNCVAQAMTLAGGKLVHMYKWDAGEALRLIEAERITTMSGVPVMSRELIAHPEFATRDTSSLTSLGGGGAQLQPDLVQKIDDEVSTARPSTGYGMTETCGIITAISADFFVDRPDSAGPAMPCYEVKCVDDDGNEVAPGEIGELWVKGAQVIKGYINRPEATAESITDGWLHTGDVARLDEDGFIYIVDRKKDMVLRGGENIYCAEVESAIFDHEAVAETTVFGVPDDRLGEEVGAAVVLSDGASLSADDLRAHLAPLIARHKIPRYVWFMDENLPRNASGKFLKRELRDALDPALAG